jgi:hypothetical protein
MVGTKASGPAAAAARRSAGISEMTCINPG